MGIPRCLIYYLFIFFYLFLFTYLLISLFIYSLYIYIYFLTEKGAEVSEIDVQIKIFTSGGLPSSRHSAPLRAASRAVFFRSNPCSRRVLEFSRFYVERTPQTCRKCFYCQRNDVWRNNFRCAGSREN